MSNRWFERRKECPACTSVGFKTIYQSRYEEPPIRDYLVEFYSPQGAVEFEYLSEATYVLCECDVCGLIFQRDIPNEVLMEKLYGHWIDPQKALIRHQKQDDIGYHSHNAQEIMQIISYLRKKPSSIRFFDFGMGWGEWALMAKAFGCESYGADLSLDRREHAQSNGIKVVMWDEIPQYRFDFINTEQVFEHIPDPLRTLLHLRTALKTDGILKISVPNANDIKRRLRIMDWKARRESKNSLIPVAPLEHINCFRMSSLLKMASEAQMEVVFIPLSVQYRHVTNWSGAKGIAKNILLPIYRNLLKRNWILLRNMQQNKN